MRNAEWRTRNLGENAERELRNAEPPPRTPQFLLPTFSFLLPLLLLLLAIEGAVEGWYRIHERNLVETPTWTVRWPEDSSGFREVPIDDDVRSTLRYDRGRQATWLRSPTSESASASSSVRRPDTTTMFFFRWEPGSASILRARSHRPDICLPNTGWEMAADHGVREYAVGTGATLPFRHFTFRRALGEGRSLSAEAFFCQREDRIPASERGQFNVTAGTTSNWARSDRIRVVQEGLRNQGQQVLEVVLMSAQPKIGQRGAGGICAARAGDRAGGAIGSLLTTTRPARRLIKKSPPLICRRASPEFSG